MFGMKKEPAKTYTIVRIEHSDGWGMFRTNYGVDIYNCSSEELDEATKKCKDRYVIGNSAETYDMLTRHHKRNNPEQDGIKRTKDMHCAFDSLETFNALVTPEEVKFLLTKDYKVLMMEVSHIEKGKHQVCYKKKDVLSTKDISSLF